MCGCFLKDKNLRRNNNTANQSKMVNPNLIIPLIAQDTLVE